LAGIEGQTVLSLVRRYRVDRRSEARVLSRVDGPVLDFGACRILAEEIVCPSKSARGLIGRGTNPPPQFGQTFCNTLSTHAAQNVHS
jgi:hypothetical protein